MQLPADVQKLFLHFEQENLKSQVEIDRREKRYSSTVFENGIGIRFWKLKHKSRTYMFCYTSKKNCVGCFLTWQSIQTGRTVKRSHIKPHDTRREAKAWAYKDFVAFREFLPKEATQ